MQSPIYRLFVRLWEEGDFCDSEIKLQEGCAYKTMKILLFLIIRAIMLMTIIVVGEA